MPCEPAAAGSPRWASRQRGVLRGLAGYPTPELEVLALELPLAAPYARLMRVLEREPFDDPGALFDVLTEDPRVQWSRSELELQMGWDTVRVEDTLAELERDGLAHRHGPFTWATRAAVRSREHMA